MEKEEETVTKAEETVTAEEKVTKIKHPGRVKAGKSLALWNKSQKERLLQRCSKDQPTCSKEQEEQEETKQRPPCCTGIAYNAMHMLGFATGVSIVGYIFYKRVYTHMNTYDKSAKRSAVLRSAQSTAQHSTTQETVKSTSEEVIKKESDPFQMQ